MAWRQLLSQGIHKCTSFGWAGINLGKLRKTNPRSSCYLWPGHCGKWKPKLHHFGFSSPFMCQPGNCGRYKGHGRCWYIPWTAGSWNITLLCGITPTFLAAPKYKPKQIQKFIFRVCINATGLCILLKAFYTAPPLVPLPGEIYPRGFDAQVGWFGSPGLIWVTCPALPFSPRCFAGIPYNEHYSHLQPAPASHQSFYYSLESI